ncbi:FxLYD domain-containing protein [Halostagnicola sp. A-GB9-2]|uniref:FxLYD domain-containing protein n=1 Tax=Halostagnicola sp. A-GB9-2 TaxID=3048066 RepID=UPI0024BF942A|nr:FxLYD domain-containing protein [Halostagnicola sp. A-GB9-2]MDJ1433539.1 FxLYD domain-containing protein [Halostagnicola sp. A-GB9-2]
MQRRDVLMGSGAAFSLILAGCAGDDAEDVEGGTRDDDNGTGDDNGSSGSADLEIVDHDLVVEEGAFSTDIYVAATVENSGDEPSGDIELQADWYDSDGNYLDNDAGRLTSLEAGETWSARVYHHGSGTEDVEDYELEGEFDEDAHEPADGLTLADSTMEVRDDELVVEGEIENETGEEQSYVEIVAKVYDEDGVALGDEWTNVTDLRADETWAFDVEYFSADIRNRIDEAEDHDILIKDSSW